MDTNVSRLNDVLYDPHPCLSEDRRTAIIITDKPKAKKTVELNFARTLDALRDLDPAAFRLYMYFALADDKKMYHFSAPEFCDWCGMNRDTFADAYNELLDADYLTIPKSNSDALYFHDAPISVPRLFFWDDDEVW